MIPLNMKNNYNLLLDQLPGYNCSRCNFSSCFSFLEKLLELKKNNKNEILKMLDLCPYLGKGRFINSKNLLLDLITINDSSYNKKIFGLIDKEEADFILGSLSNESTCREDIYKLNTKVLVNKNDYIKYRPLGCPITHFAHVLSIKDDIITIHMVGPKNRINNLIDSDPIDIGLCLIIGFEGQYLYGKIPKVGQTVKFIPNDCMMQKVHKGIITSQIGDKLRIEAIDLKV